MKKPLNNTDFSDSEFNELSSEFYETCKEEVELYLYDDDADPDSIREFAETLSNVASYFDTDIDESLDALEEWAIEIEERSYEPDYDDEYRGTLGDSDDSLEAVEDLFNTLLD